jgi:hypothetical protein
MDIEVAPVGIFDNGLDDPFEKDADGEIWFDERSQKYPFDDFNWDWKARL